MPDSIISVGDVARERVSGRFGIVTDVPPSDARRAGKNARSRARLIRGPKEAWWSGCAGLEQMVPADLGGGFRFGQFVKRISGDKKQTGMMLEYAGGRYTMLCADAKCYPKGTKYAAGKWYRADETAEASAGERDLFLFKLNTIHTGAEYAANLAAARAKWDREGLGEASKRFMPFWKRILLGVGDNPGVTWGARLRTAYSPAPSINFYTEHPEELHDNMFCFFDLSKEPGGPALSVFLKKAAWIPERAAALFPGNRDKKFYMDGHWTMIPLAHKNDEELSAVADALIDMYKSAGVK